LTLLDRVNSISISDWGEEDFKRRNSCGDPILQPGPYDRGKWPDDRIADLSEFVPIVFTESGPPGDCGLARLIAAVWNGIAKGIGSRSRLRAITLQALESFPVQVKVVGPIKAL